LQSHTYEEGLPRKCGNISPYMRRPLVIYDYATAPFWISLYMRKIWFSFYISAIIISASPFLCQSRVTVLNQGAVLIRRRGRPVASSDEEDEEEVERKNTDTEADKDPPPPARDPLEVKRHISITISL
jgi:hypothetical protein